MEVSLFYSRGGRDARSRSHAGPPEPTRASVSSKIGAPEPGGLAGTGAELDGHLRCASLSTGRSPALT